MLLNHPSIELVWNQPYIELEPIHTHPLSKLITLQSAAFCFARSAPALHARLLLSPTFGPAITSWQAKGAIAPRHKAMAVGMMLAAFVGAYAVGAPTIALVVQVVFMGSAALFVLTRPNA